MKWILPIVAVMLLIAACSTGTTQEQKNETPVVEEPQTHTQVEKYSIPSIEVRMDENDFFEPSTIVVPKGKTLRLHFINAKPYLFNIPELGITEYAGGNYLDIYGERTGEYSFECSDCKEKHPGVLKII